MLIYGSQAQYKQIFSLQYKVAIALLVLFFLLMVRNFISPAKKDIQFSNSVTVVSLSMENKPWKR